jgi:hypothetical protein
MRTSRLPSGPGRAPVAALRELVVVDVGEHRLPGGAQHRHDEPARRVGERVGRLVVDDVATGLPERLARRDGALGLALELEDDRALEDVTGDRPGVPVRCRARVAGRQVDRHDHHLGAGGDERGSFAEQLGQGGHTATVAATGPRDWASHAPWSWASSG